jgi:predicted DNA binding CopG/RHH family protein
MSHDTQPTSMLTVAVPAELHKAVKVHAAQHGLTIQQLVTDALTKALGRKGKS